MGDTLYQYTSTNMAAAAPKVKKAKAPAAHPPYASMITAATKALGDKKGSSRQAILKYVVANNKVDAAKAAVRVRLALKKMIAAKKVVAAAAAGKKGAGSFKLPAKAPKVKKAKKPKKLRRQRNQLPRRLRSQRRLPKSQPKRLLKSLLLRRLLRSLPRRLHPRRSKLFLTT